MGYCLPRPGGHVSASGRTTKQQSSRAYNGAAHAEGRIPARSKQVPIPTNGKERQRLTR